MMNSSSNDVEIKEEKITKPNVTWQHIWLFDETRNALLESSFISIPNEILLRIFQLFSVRELCNISLVCRMFKMVADQDEIWKSKCNTSTKLYSKSFKQIYMDWIYAKCLRNEEVQNMNKWSRLACIGYLPPTYPVRSTNNQIFQPIREFKHHPNASPNITIKLSVDIDNTARELMKFLEKSARLFKKWEDIPIIKQMIMRYYRFMLLKASQPSNILLIPTLDIEIIWQTHLLRPEIYQSDCLRLFRRIINHSLLLTDIEQAIKEQAFQDTCQLYEQRFNEKYCPLPSIDDKEEEIIINSNSHCHSSDPYDSTNPGYSYWDRTYFQFSLDILNNYENPFSIIEADIIIDRNWLDMCKQFMSDALEKAPIRNYYRGRSTKIDLGHGAMIRLKKSYERFLYMATKYPLKDRNSFVPPTYAIDIIWHSHMQQPLDYIADCIRFVGYVIYHAPWPIVEDDMMQKIRDQLDDIWKEEFQTDINMDHLYNTIDNKADIGVNVFD